MFRIIGGNRMSILQGLAVVVSICVICLLLAFIIIEFIIGDMKE
jgi:hypothetical protein